MCPQQGPDATIQAMQQAANAFYRDAVRIGNHPFIEFAGLMNEYINACREAVSSGTNFTSCNTHTGQHLPLHAHQVDYINEKLESLTPICHSLALLIDVRVVCRYTAHQ